MICWNICKCAHHLLQCGHCVLKILKRSDCAFSQALVATAAIQGQNIPSLLSFSFVKCFLWWRGLERHLSTVKFVCVLVCARVCDCGVCVCGHLFVYICVYACVRLLCVCFIHMKSACRASNSEVEVIYLWGEDALCIGIYRWRQRIQHLEICKQSVSMPCCTIPIIQHIKWEMTVMVEQEHTQRYRINTVIQYSLHISMGWQNVLAFIKSYRMNNPAGFLLPSQAPGGLDEPLI